VQEINRLRQEVTGALQGFTTNCLKKRKTETTMEAT
jgi:hypothetical protein